jgi:starch synthase (maltosyl-transferring)
MSVREGRRRVVIEGVKPEIDCGRFPVKRTVGDEMVVEADVFDDGHDKVAAVLRWQREGEDAWNEVAMEELGNDRWRASFPVTRVGGYRYTVTGWVDRWRTWREDLEKRVAAGQDVSVDLVIGAKLISDAARRASGADARELRAQARELLSGTATAQDALDEDLDALVARHPDKKLGTRYERQLEVVVDRERARFGAWYEFFPRSFGPRRGKHATFADTEKLVRHVAKLGFDIAYLPPIHPIGESFRKGRNNDPVGTADDPGSPWAIGSAEGGHKAINPALGTFEDFDRFVARAAELGMEVALDLAYQCSPDHPYVREHPEWFHHRPDGSIQYAENPPKKYQDIYPLDFETADWRALWDELKSVVDFWVGHGVKIFRVDNPHTKSFAFWEWMISAVKREDPDVLFLSEAFTRPKIMYRLAKIGFTQSYTYFTWRTEKWELLEYFGTDLPKVRDFFRPNLWPNTPDILAEHLQAGGRPAFVARLVLAATLGASYGMYGPAFELMERTPLAPGKEEYLHSEKYEIRTWPLDRKDSLAPLIARVNAIRRANPALQRDDTLQFHPVNNDDLIAYSKSTGDGSNIVLVVVNLHPSSTHSGWVDLPLEDMGLDPYQPFEVHDLLTDARYHWRGSRNYVELNPMVIPAHIFEVIGGRAGAVTAADPTR